jgi:PKD repeat protein
MNTGGPLWVTFDSVQLTTPPPQAYSFGVVAKTIQGNWITNLVWQFGDGKVLNVPYCCQHEVSEVQYHAYAQPGTYTVVVIAFDNAGNYGNANVTVNWIGSGDPPTPVPEYPVGLLPLVASLVVAFFGIASIKKRLKH